MPCKSSRIVTFGPALVNFAVNSRLRKLNKSRPFAAGKTTRRFSALRALYATSCNLRHAFALARNGFIIAAASGDPHDESQYGCGLLLILLLTVLPSAAKELRATIVYDDTATDLAAAREDAGQLWITTADLKRATRFEVKPQGVCRDELCFPLPKARQRSLFIRRRQRQLKSTWFNMTAFAELVHQPVAHDAALSTWYFGLRSDQRQQLSSLQAPDFTLPDLQGKLHRLSDFRGKKILLVTWASW